MATKKNNESGELNIHQRIHATMKDVRYLQKQGSGNTKGLPYAFVSHDQVIGLLQPAFVANGIAVVPTVEEMTQDGNRTVVKLNVSFVNIDNPTDSIHVTYWGYGIDSQDKGPGKAYSYAFKYALLKTFCLETGNDDVEAYNEQYQAEEHLSKEQIQELEVLINGYDDIRTTILERCHNDMRSLKKSQFNMIKAWIMKMIKAKGAM